VKKEIEIKAYSSVKELRKSDVNGSRNISKRALGKPETRSMLGAGASVAMPELPSDDLASVKQGGERRRTLERL